jgi:signal recognition particle GTPase
MNEFCKYLKANDITGIKEKLARAQKEEIQALRRDIQTLEALSPEERLNPKLIKGPTKKRILQEIGVSNAEVNVLIKKFESTVMLHKLVRERSRRGLPLPETQMEVAMLMQEYAYSHRKIQAKSM